MKKKLKESLTVTPDQLENPDVKKLAQDPKTPLQVTDNKPNSSSSSSAYSTPNTMAMKETASLEPEPIPNIKYLSNVKDTKSGEISKPFTIADKHYQMVRGTNQSGEVVLGVYCHDDINESGENIIHPVDYFEENIVKPFHEGLKIKESKNIESAPVEKPKNIGLSDYKYYLVNEKTGKFRKFKNVTEVAKSNMLDEEKLMSLREFKKYFEERVFGKKKAITEDEVVDVEDPKKLQKKAENLVNAMKSNPKIEKAMTQISKGNTITKAEVINTILKALNIKPEEVTKLTNVVKNVGHQNKENNV